MKLNLPVKVWAVEQVAVIVPSAVVAKARAELERQGWKVLLEKAPGLNDPRVSYPATKLVGLRNDNFRDVSDVEPEVLEGLKRALE